VDGAEDRRHGLYSYWALTLGSVIFTVTGPVGTPTALKQLPVED
jgi:hypothetical protein